MEAQKEAKQTVLISFFRFTPGKRLWAMFQMAIIPGNLKRLKGLTFSKILGTGGGEGYNFKPDFRTYALLTVWERSEYAFNFESHSRVMKKFRNHSAEIYSLFLSPIQSRGKWSGKNPFQPSNDTSTHSIIVVLTRATLKIKYYIPFWKRVGKVSKSLENFPGLIFTKGIGERPWIMQATFSVWRSVKDMEEFAHNKEGNHYEAISTTRRLKGFREELYARFKPIETRGTWRGKDPVGLLM